MKVILLAAGRGRRFGDRTRALPKCLIPLRRGENLLSRYLASFRKLELKRIVLVVGHQKEKIRRACSRHGRGLSIRFLENRRYRLGSVVSLQRASAEMDEDCLVMDADVFFENRDLQRLLSKKKTAFLMDPRARSTGEEMMLMARGRRLCRISKRVDPRLRSVGEATGFFRVARRDARLLASILDRRVREGRTGTEYEEAYNELMETCSPACVAVSGFWMEMDFEDDLEKIRARLGARPKP